MVKTDETFLKETLAHLPTFPVVQELITESGCPRRTSDRFQLIGQLPLAASCCLQQCVEEDSEGKTGLGEEVLGSISNVCRGEWCLVDHVYLPSWTESCNNREVRPRDRRDLPGVKQNIGGRGE